MDRNMDRNKKVIVTLIVLAIAIVGVLLVVSLTGDSNGENDNATTTDVTDNDNNRIITAKHQFEDGTHVVAGEVELPTPCDLLETDVKVAESFPEQVTIGFTTRNESETCAQVITAQRFKVEFEASEDATIRATFNGENVRLNLIEVEEGEDLDDFEVFIKG